MYMLNILSPSHEIAGESTLAPASCCIWCGKCPCGPGVVVGPGTGVELGIPFVIVAPFAPGLALVLVLVEVEELEVDPAAFWFIIDAPGGGGIGGGCMGPTVLIGVGDSEPGVRAESVEDEEEEVLRGVVVCRGGMCC